ncbi:MAG: alkylhydroperoxidase [Methylobacter sp.]|nr:MAG: alkylhydroperoxidase [Methylobacter sp.]PPD33879.1 MAG: alkylhydroperoxidase [Methylomonas sp.]
MSERINYWKLIGPEATFLTQIEDKLNHGPLDLRLLETVRLRASQINGCGFCVRYHSQRLRMLGETEERIDLIIAWREAPCYSEREQAVLQWAETITLLSDHRNVPDTMYEQTRQFLSEEELASLTLAVAMANVWNRIAVAFRTDHSSIETLLKAADNMEQYSDQKIGRA